MGKKKIFLHVGHGKTGTSATQYVLARHAVYLREQGILYPNHPDPKVSELAHAGRITSGNVCTDRNPDDWISAQILPQIERFPEFEVYVFSNESLMWSLGQQLQQAAMLTETYDLRIILSVREPHEMLASGYCQFVKRHGFTGKIEDYEPQEVHTILAAELLRLLRENGVQFSVLNYSVLKGNISREILKLIGLSDGNLKEMDFTNTKKVNRSLTSEETKLIIALNKSFDGQYGNYCSDTLVEEFPDIQYENEYVPEEIFLKLKERVLDSVAYINEFLPAGQALRLVLPPQTTSDSKITEQQLEAFFHSLKIQIDAEKKHIFRYPWKYFGRFIARE